MCKRASNDAISINQKQLFEVTHGISKMEESTQSSQMIVQMFAARAESDGCVMKLADRVVDTVDKIDKVHQKYELVLEKLREQNERLLEEKELKTNALSKALRAEEELERLKSKLEEQQPSKRHKPRDFCEKDLWQESSDDSYKQRMLAHLTSPGCNVPGLTKKACVAALRFMGDTDAQIDAKSATCINNAERLDCVKTSARAHAAV